MNAKDVAHVVTAADTAAAWGNEFPAAASTPFLLGLAELACHALVADELGDGVVTVGTTTSIEHLAPSPVGATLVARATLLSNDGRRFAFSAEVLDGTTVAARVEHTRASVPRASIERAMADR